MFPSRGELHVAMASFRRVDMFGMGDLARAVCARERYQQASGQVILAYTGARWEDSASLPIVALAGPTCPHKGTVPPPFPARAFRYRLPWVLLREVPD